MANRPTPHRDPDNNAALVEYLARERYTRLCAVARQAGAADDAVEDAVQGAMVDVLRSFRGPYDLGHGVAYAVRCVQTQVWKAHRRYQRKESRHAQAPERVRADRLATTEEVGLADPSEPGPLEIAIASEAGERARELLEQLPADQGTVLVLGAAGFSSEEIAELTGLSQRAVRKRVEKANRRLRKLREEAE